MPPAMPPKPRSVKQQMDRLTGQLREREMTWRQVAGEYRTRFNLNPLRAFREAHRYTQAKVVREWNQRWPDEPLNERRLGAWEAWPSPSGNEPPISGLERLARIYQCRAGDLVDGEDHGRTDQQTARRHPSDAALSPRTLLTPQHVRQLLQTLPAPPPRTTPADAAGQAHSPVTARLHEQEFGHMVAVLTQWAGDMNRRDLLALIAAAAAAAHASPLVGHLDQDALERLARAAHNPARVDEATVEHVRAIMHHAIRQEDVLGPQAVLETVLAQHGLVRRLLNGNRDPRLQQRLLAQFADVSRFIGWLLFNAGDFGGAEHYYAQARRAAHDADDDLLTSYTLAQWSHLATWTGDPRLGVEHALGALAWAQRADSPILTAYAHDVGARAYAGVLRRERAGPRARSRTRDHGRCRSAMAASRTRLGDSTPGDPGHDLVYFFEPNMATLTGALCHLDLHEPEAAITAAREAITAMGGRYPRNQAFGHLYLSKAYAQQREIGQACAELVEVAKLIDRNRSHRLITVATEARRALSPWNRTDEILRLDEQLRAYGLPVGSTGRSIT